MAKNLTRKDFLELTECDCGKPLFKVTDTSRNISYARCNYVKEEYDIKKHAWVPSKKQPCNFVRIYHGERPVFKEIQQAIKWKYNSVYNLEKELRSLFSFLMVSNRTSTLDEINIIVRTKLKREPLKKFFSEDGKFSHYESYTDYRDRIFSEKIIEISPDVKKPEVPVEYPGSDILKKIDHTGFGVSRKPKKKIKKKIKEKIVYDDYESDNNSDSHSESSDSESEYSEYSDSELSEDSLSESESEASENIETFDIPEYESAGDYDSGGEYDYDD